MPPCPKPCITPHRTPSPMTQYFARYTRLTNQRNPSDKPTEIMLHAGPETILSTFRQKIWLTQGRREVKRDIRRCVACQKQRVGLWAQKMGKMPEERVSCSPAFAHVGTDFVGPLYVKEGSTTQKVYVCQFTCASSRMIHLELTHSLKVARLDFFWGISPKFEH